MGDHAHCPMPIHRIEGALIGMSGHRSLASRMQRGSTAAARREGTRTPEKHERPGQKPQAFSVELLTAYSHTAQAVDLPLLSHRGAHQPGRCPETECATSVEPVRTPRRAGRRRADHRLPGRRHRILSRHCPRRESQECEARPAHCRCPPRTIHPTPAARGSAAGRRSGADGPETSSGRPTTGWPGSAPTRQPRPATSCSKPAPGSDPNKPHSAAVVFI